MLVSHIAINGFYSNTPVLAEQELEQVQLCVAKSFQIVVQFYASFTAIFAVLTNSPIDGWAGAGNQTIYLPCAGKHFVWHQRVSLALTFQRFFQHKEKAHDMLPQTLYRTSQFQRKICA